METEWRAARAQLREALRVNPQASHAELATQLGYSVSWVRKWRKRFATAQEDEERLINSLPHQPKQVVRKVSEDLEERIIALRMALSEQFNRLVGARTIAAYLRRESLTDKTLVPLSSTTIWRILHRRQYILSPSKSPHQPFERPTAGLCWELDFCTAAKHSPEAPDKKQNALEVFNVVDRGTSFCLESRASAQYDAETTLMAVAAVLERWGIPQCITYDRDPRLVGSHATDEYPSAFTRFLLCLGCEADMLPPHRPDLKPFVERFQRSLQEECLTKHHPTTANEANPMLDTYRHWHNHERPHQGRGNQDAPPHQRFAHRPALRPVPDTVDPDAWLQHYHQRTYRRHVDMLGTFQLWKQTYSIGKAYANQKVLLRLDAQQRLLHVEIGAKRVKSIPLKGLYNRSVDYAEFRGLMLDEARSDWKNYLWRQQLKRATKAS